MPQYSIFKNVMTGMSVSVVTLALGAAFAEARGVGAGHQTTIQTAAVGRATNPPQVKSLIYDAVADNCDTLNCGAVFMNGNSQRDNLGDSIPFTAKVYADANECLRLEVTYQGTKVPSQPENMRIVLVSPIGSVWRSDNTHPVVTARTDVKGHYTVQINQSNEVEPINSVHNFGVAYGRYVIGTPINCPDPEPATFAELVQ